jgi:hypothetical protein
VLKVYYHVGTQVYEMNLHVIKDHRTDKFVVHVVSLFRPDGQYIGQWLRENMPIRVARELDKLFNEYDETKTWHIQHVYADN